MKPFKKPKRSATAISWDWQQDPETGLWFQDYLDESGRYTSRIFPPLLTCPHWTFTNLHFRLIGHTQRQWAQPETPRTGAVEETPYVDSAPDNELSTEGYYTHNAAQGMLVLFELVQLLMM